MTMQRQHTLPFHRRSKGQAVTIKEAVIQSHIEGTLRSLGYIVLSTSEHRKAEPCPHCFQWMTPKQGRGCDKGVPDLLVTSGPRRKVQYPAGVWIGLEVKGPKTPLSAEQKILKEADCIFVVRSVDEALEVVAEAEEYLAVR